MMMIPPPSASTTTTLVINGSKNEGSSINKSPEEPSCCQQQLLVRFENKTHVISIPSPPFSNGIIDDDDNDQQRQRQKELWLLKYFSTYKTNWNIDLLKIKSWNYPYVEICVKSQILGGKGGFGTLLKGQSRQAGAKLTTDFGACRDLQGRRLRHVNDEIKLRKWREMQKAKAAGEKVDENESMWNTPSGIYNWHLMTPTWADISKKATYRIKRQFQAMDKAQLKKQKLKEEQQEAYQNSMKHYLEQATVASNQINENFQDALKQGLAMSKTTSNSKKRKQRPGESTEYAATKTATESGLSNSIESYQPNSLCTLSGDVVVKNDNNSSSNKNGEEEDFVASVEIQSKSDFATAVLVLDRYPSSLTDGDNANTQQESTTIYFEVSLETGGMAQIGWACLSSESDGVEFQPNNELGDGVGDDNASYGIDGTRKLKFHGGQETAFDLEWKQGDRLGCLWNIQNGNLSFQINGKDCLCNSKKNSASTTAVAFTTPKFQKLVPAFSCNQNEILGLHVHPKECKYLPTLTDGGRVVTVGELIINDNDNEEEKKESDNNSADKKEEQESSKPAAAAATTTTSTKVDDQKQNAGEAVEPSMKAAADDEKAEAATTNTDAGATKKMASSSTTTFDTNNIKPLDLSKYESSKELESLGMDRLKGALMAIKVKCGGTLAERAARLFSLKGLQRKDYPKKVRAKGFIEY